MQAFNTREVVMSAVDNVLGAVLHDQGDVNPDLFIGLPFQLSCDKVSADWLGELDFVCPHFGDLNELRKLAESAPSESAKTWLDGIISSREFHGIMTQKSI